MLSNDYFLNCEISKEARDTLIRLANYHGIKSVEKVKTYKALKNLLIRKSESEINHVKRKAKKHGIAENMDSKYTTPFYKFFSDLKINAYSLMSFMANEIIDLFIALDNKINYLSNADL
ncbi:hypothetical protein DCO58_11830 [Helicobacter saguini]|uniref:Uncharacterized protein n=1 Tax=Helicobacter saguini TaxID=1548018 RepID=A0A347VQA0_9HELI|nr:hypothetical protein [Helicobacter saguini]MWV61022.1 hypothetical protein [Helicobacter saguini]MWV68309.1 hypothetical protein [Helicobacter saguini]MWV70226.1 hypothetical protein [Helicobacter saguini]MWV72129.1 hypothetical protein [Helicobacter saguini]TLD91632.1 hypothetical protein LS64_011610 [Helicobacter saguini]